MNSYYYKITCVNEDLDENEDVGVVIAKNYADAMDKLVEDYGASSIDKSSDDIICSVFIEFISEGNCISKDDFKYIFKKFEE